MSYKIITFDNFFDYLCVINESYMVFEFLDEDLEALVNHEYKGRYKPYRINAKLIKMLDNVMRYLEAAADIKEVAAIGSLAYEHLKGSLYSSVRVGYKTKYRLIFQEHEDKLTLLLIELSEHYGDH